MRGFSVLILPRHFFSAEERETELEGGAAWKLQSWDSKYHFITNSKMRWGAKSSSLVKNKLHGCGTLACKKIWAQGGWEVLLGSILAAQAKAESILGLWDLPLLWVLVLLQRTSALESLGVSRGETFSGVMCPSQYSGCLVLSGYFLHQREEPGGHPMDKSQKRHWSFLWSYSRSRSSHSLCLFLSFSFLYLKCIL